MREKEASLPFLKSENPEDESLRDGYVSSVPGESPR
jgi:hypothetical protein